MSKQTFVMPPKNYPSPLEVFGEHAAAPNVTLSQLQANCEKLAAETFGRETVDDGDRLDYRTDYNTRLKKCLCAETYRSLPPRGHQHVGLLVRSPQKSITAALKTSNATQKASGTHL